MTDPRRPGRPTSRRGFLQAVGAVGGAGAALTAMGALGLAPTSASAATPPFRAPRESDFTLTGRSAASVAVVGAGVAGLTAAYELRKAGHDVTVLDARPRIGGRSLTVRAGDTLTDKNGVTQRAGFAPGQYFNAGPAMLPQWSVSTDYCRELHVPLEVFSVSNANTFVFDPNRPDRMRYQTARADAYGVVAELLAKVTNQGSLDRQLTAADKERLLGFLRTMGDLGADGAYAADPRRRGFAVHPGAAGFPGEPLPPRGSLDRVFSEQLSRHWYLDAGFDMASTLLQPVGGMDRIVEALADCIGRPRIRCGVEVTSITDGPQGTRVEYRGSRSGALDVDYCIVTTPPRVAARIAGLSTDVVRLLGGFMAEFPGKVGLEYRSRWWEDDHAIYGGLTSYGRDGSLWYPSSGYHGERGVMVAYFEQAETTIQSWSPARRAAEAVDRNERVHGAKARTELASSISVMWGLEPFIEGGWQAADQENNGAVNTPAFRPLTDPSGRVFFAGDWLGNMLGWQHGSMVSARQAVEKVHARALAG
ncbi:flavin monoamine oxidase family protein [Embleya scabrispora]|uniref:flavin monoamine oxidase family protein n=1 Tax=Embleya scabrispora TaxID=159449 RepID=UPI0003A41CD8|nr:FAD-dependent oxidoreductase [Embleya scabrispora]MYS86902.1 FAD-dependent oxidoreductase [Streptomyces sp. SID5474]